MSRCTRCRKRGKWGRAFLVLLAGGVLLAGAAGCTRRFFRKRADEQVDALMAEKDKYPFWKLDQYHVYPDPRARFADWTNPDRPPMPPDDPAAYDLSPRSQRVPCAGVAYIEGTGYLDVLNKWDQENRVQEEKDRRQTEERRRARGEVRATPEEQTVEERDREIEERIQRELAPPTPRDRTTDEVNTTPTGPRPYLLNLEQIVELGFFNSREFQLERENLYLTALPVTAERFAFAAQPFLTEEVIREQSGKNSSAGKTNNWQFGTTLGFAKLFSTGGLLLFQFANETVYNLGKTLTGPSSVSTISFDAIQPFLQGGGRAVTLEPLTQAERNLLYAIRDYMRYRQQFFVYLASGQPVFIPGVTPGVPAIAPNTVSSPPAASPTITPPVLPLSSNPVTLAVKPGASGVQTPLPGIGPTPQGFLGTVNEKWQLANAYKNIASLRRFQRQFEIWLEGGIVTALQLGQVRQQLLKSIETVLGNQANFRISVDQLRQQVGLPMTIPLDLTSTDLRPVIRQTERYDDLTADFEALSLRSEALESVEPAQLRQRLRQLYAASTLTRDTRARDLILRRWADWEKTPPPKKGEVPTPLDQRIAQVRQQRKALLDRRAAQEGTLSKADQDRLDEMELEYRMGLFERALRNYEAQPWLEFKGEAVQRINRALQFRYARRWLIDLAEVAYKERQERIKEQWPPLPPVCVEGVDLLDTAEEEALAAMTRGVLSNRLDLMNNRAQLVDAWRKIAVAANELLGTFTVDYHLSANTPLAGGKPFDFQRTGTVNQLFFNASLPLVRILQRNTYRSTLINYQQIRRYLMQNEDQALFEVRIDLRNLRAAAYNYQRIQKENIELAYRLVEGALQAFSQPQAPAGFAGPPGLVGPTAGIPQAGDPAALTLQLLSVQAALLTAQNDLYTTWTSFLATRMALYRDLGIMPLDSRGVWIDNHAAECECNSGTSAQAPLRPVPGQGLPLPLTPSTAPPSGFPEQLPPPRNLPPVPPAPGGGT